MKNSISRKEAGKLGVSVSSMVLLLAVLGSIISMRVGTHNSELNKKGESFEEPQPSYSDDITPYLPNMSSDSSHYENNMPIRNAMYYHENDHVELEKVREVHIDVEEDYVIDEDPEVVMPSYEEKLSSFLEYSNIQDEETFNNFAQFFINYSNNENIKTVEDVLDMLYGASLVSEEEKLAFVLDYYDLADSDDNYKFRVLEAVCETEAARDGACYEDAYGVISTIYNRVHSKETLLYVNYVLRTTDAINLYSQAICPGQFQVYGDKLYLKAMGRTETSCYKAVLDMLYLRTPIHDRLDFLSSNQKKEGSVQIVSDGNNYSRSIKESDYTDELEVKNAYKALEAEGPELIFAF